LDSAQDRFSHCFAASFERLSMQLVNQPDQAAAEFA
jgi:hypothetical protein